jgi:hypothetical protein
MSIIRGTIIALSAFQSIDYTTDESTIYLSTEFGDNEGRIVFTRTFLR